MSGRRTALNWLGEHGFRCVDGDEVRAAECGLAGEAPMATIAQDGNELERMSDISMSFILAIDAPHGVRWRRQMASGGGSLEDFVKKSDSLMYDCDQKGTPLRTWMSNATIRAMNQGSLEEFYSQLESLDLRNPKHARPSWDMYFLQLAVLASRRTNCMKRAVGAVIVKSNRVVSTGYNGTASGLTNCSDGGCKRCNSFARMGVSLDVCLCLHAEENAIIEAGSSRCENATLYSSLFPCLACTKLIMQVGITRVIYNSSYATDERAEAMMISSGIQVLRGGPL
eukprot:CAMPEP_0113965964 /NCGR_PEP_ID=MMETSP0011_2-20120614/8056_1 /TAXON_ID=101924 /ORGANISM="Rhodosorus marinus" /LENGTH=282 /DNA_ID=CAMNT_0000978573 /DNA_START=44 /DNA_END=892 /DNA_ORIENTATION=+ /assembly_acc=CAM_ASM_000156